ncbi:MAG: M20 family metallopeptidase [Phycisphaerales bacterium]
MTTTADRLRDLVADCAPHAVGIRHDLHAHPELMYEEERTSRVVREELARLGVEHLGGLAGGTGVLAHLPATTPDGAKKPSVALRADMDALPILERTGVAYSSTTDGVMHACGHDGHTATLLCAAAALAKVEHRPNPVTFLFQPAEEGGAGGERMCADGALDGSRLGTRVGRVFGLHGWPSLEIGHVSTKPGPLLAATDDFAARISGHQAHAAMPHTGVDPIVAGAHIVSALQTIASRTVDPLDSVVCTVGRFEGGSANNVIPESVEIAGTIRSLRAETRATAERRFREIVELTAKAHGCRVEIDWKTGYPVTDNHPEATAFFERIARDTLGAARLERTPDPFMGGEDFAFYGAVAPACFFLLGLQRPGDASPAMLHTPDFDFNDDALPIGAELFCRLALAE